jgi:hypothetical protein
VTEAEIRAYRILDIMQAFRDWRELEEMNGKRCGGRQSSQLHRYQTSQIAFKDLQDRQRAIAKRKQVNG